MNRYILVVAVGLIICCGSIASAQESRQSYRTTNFLVSGGSAAFNRRVGDEAERLYQQQSRIWFGVEGRRLRQPVPIRMNIVDRAASGVTSFLFQNQQFDEVEMGMTGREDDVFNNVLPHEIFHVTSRVHLRKSLPRWVDEGASTVMETVQFRGKMLDDTVLYLKENRGLPTGQMLDLTQYPRDIYVLYAQGHSLTTYLVRLGGNGPQGCQKFMRFMRKAMDEGEYVAALQEFYGIGSLTQLQDLWLGWVLAGSPKVPAQFAAYQGEMVPFYAAELQFAGNGEYVLCPQPGQPIAQPQIRIPPRPQVVQPGQPGQPRIDPNVFVPSAQDAGTTAPPGGEFAASPGTNEPCEPIAPIVDVPPRSAPVPEPTPAEPIVSTPVEAEPVVVEQPTIAEAPCDCSDLEQKLTARLKELELSLKAELDQQPNVNVEGLIASLRAEIKVLQGKLDALPKEPIAKPATDCEPTERKPFYFEIRPKK